MGGDSAKSSETKTGEVLSYLRDVQYGFICPGPRQPDMFFHYHDIMQGNFEIVNGMMVDFEEGPDNRPGKKGRMRATYVRPHGTPRDNGTYGDTAKPKPRLPPPKNAQGTVNFSRDWSRERKRERGDKRAPRKRSPSRSRSW